MTLTKKINISEIIELYDMQNRENSKHISSITGLIGEDLLSGLLKHYLCRNEDGVDVKIDESVTPKQKGKNGKMLDRWILTSKLGVADKCYQTEIKNWSSHSLSGVKFDFNPELPLDFDTNKSDEIFNKIWDNNAGEILHPSVNKVLYEMHNKPSEIELNPEPLVCFWMPITFKGIKKPFFNLNHQNITKKGFKGVSFFSGSIYLRSLLHSDINEIEIEMPNVIKRMSLITPLFNN
jgi:hypothetical protein